MSLQKKKLDHHWLVILRLMGDTKRSDKNSKKNKRLQLQREIIEIRITYFTKKRNEVRSNRNFQKNLRNFLLWQKCFQ